MKKNKSVSFKDGFIHILTESLNFLFKGTDITNPYSYLLVLFLPLIFLILGIILLVFRFFKILFRK